jgi:hypothetical protein
MAIFREVEPAGLLLTLRNDIAANSEHSDWALWFKYGACAALLHVNRGIADGVDPEDVLQDLRDNILRLEQDRANAPGAAVDIWPVAPQQKTD